MNILGKSVATAAQMAAYLLSVNANPQIDMPVVDFCRLFLYMGALEGVRGDFLFAQSCKETGNFKFNGTVKAEQNNYAGLGTTDVNTPGATFPDEATGILAQAQHAKGYATTEPLNYECVDPRYSLLATCSKLGVAPTVEDLGGKWAVPGYDTKKYASLEEANAAHDSYGYQIIDILNRIIGDTEERKDDVVMSKKIYLDAGHGLHTAGKRCLASIDSKQTREWTLNSRIAEMLEKALAEYDCEVVRVDDVTGAKDIALATRVKKANNAKADMYVSIHHNAGINGGSGGGTVVFYYSSKAERKNQAQRLYNAVVSKTGLVGNRSTKVGKTPFYVIKNTNMPAFLIENGFMDSKTDVPIILSAEHAKKTAEGILTFLVGELSLQKKKAVTEPNSDAESSVDNSYRVKVAHVAAGDVLHIRKKPSYLSAKVGKLAYNDPNVYTIVETKNGWGKLKSGLGWINLKYTQRV